MRVDSQKLAIRASSKILVEYSPCPVEAILSAVIAVVTRFRTRKSAKPESTVCSEEKYELPRGSINAVKANKWQIIKHYPKEIPWLTSYLSEEYTAVLPWHHTA